MTILYRCFTRLKVGEMTKAESTEHFLVDTLLSTLISKDDVASAAHSFLKANSGAEVGQKMLEMWERYVINLFFFDISQPNF